MASGYHPDSPEFDVIWQRVLRQVGARLGSSAEAG